MIHAWTETLGWVATATFVASYFFSRASWLRVAQMLGSLLWISYGVLIGARPVMVANVLVFAAAAWTFWRRPAPQPPKADTTPPVGTSPP